MGFRFFGDKPRQMTFKTSDKALNWLFEEHPPVRISNLVIPKTAKHVNTFYERAKPPTYADFGTKQTIENAIQAYDQLKSVEYRVRAGSETTRVIWQENSARQDDAVLKWSYHQGQLTIYAIKSGELFRGATALRHVPDYLHALGGSIDPTLRLLLSGRNPIEVLFAPGTKAQTVAQSSAHGVILQVVELSRPMLKIQLQFRSGQPLPVSVGVENLDAASRVVSQSERNFEYLAENQPYSGSTFRVGDSGQSVLPLPTLNLPKSK